MLKLRVMTLLPPGDYCPLQTAIGTIGTALIWAEDVRLSSNIPAKNCACWRASASLGVSSA